MINAVVVNAAAAAAAAEAARRMREEEEEMTPYTGQELTENWEFKIIRSNTGSFRKPEIFRQMLAEESESGWQLVEKFDDGRVRLKRPRGAPSSVGDGDSGRDPYRTTYGMSQGALVTWILVGTFAGIAVLIGVVVAFVANR